jgi:hypothetical protein
VRPCIAQRKQDEDGECEIFDSQKCLASELQSKRDAMSLLFI